MAKASWHGQVIKFSPKLLVWNGSYLNKDIAWENLKLFNQFMEKYSIPYIWAYGTCLGIVRDKDFISHDEDCDVMTPYDSYDKIFSHLNDLKELGFSIVRFDERGLISLWRNDEYIDIYAYREYNERTYICCNMFIYPKNFFDKIKKVNFRDIQVPVPEEVEDYLLYEYGETWKTPIKYLERTRWSFLLKILLYIQIVTPIWLQRKYLRKKELNEQKKYEQKYETYLTWKKMQNKV